ncbi:DUF4878 domain-containing protein [Lujinxingia litoralis]|uniref:DUF4878 domain-containing protein n=1 Tax=Lujinxingia litoralis TaxID=2211119 RepID=UPI001314EAC4|nr:DUF4878 domain-containing protein [Lujinxingia litoralis]
MMRVRAMWAWLIGGMVMALVSGCERGDDLGQQAPEEVAVAYLEAMRDGQVEKAWAMVTRADQEAMPLKVLQAQRDQAQERIDEVAATMSFEVGEVRPQDGEVVVEVSLKSTSDALPPAAARPQEIRVRQTAAGWRVDTEWAEKAGSVLDRPEGEGAPGMQ